jgi:NitT/TauT family transport system substrate-binding protein
MPEMTLEWILKENNIDPKKDVNIDTSVAFAAMGSSFIGGNGDFVSLFEPTALQIEKEGYGYVVASLGELGGVVPYTSFSARKSYIKNNKQTIEKFRKALQRGLDYVEKESNEQIAKDILKQFPDTSQNDLTKVIKRYKSINAWPKTTEFKEESWNHLQDIMIEAGQLETKVPYNELIYEK